MQIALLCALALLGAAVAQVGAGVGGAPTAPIVWDSIDVVALVLAGAWVWRRTPTTRAGQLLVVTGVVIGLSVLVYLDDAPALRLVGMVALPLFAPPLTLALLGFPSGRASGADRHVVLAMVLLTTVLWWVVLATYEPEPGGPATWATPWADRETFEVLGGAHWALTAITGPVIAWRLVRRWRGSSPAARRIRAPVTIAGAITAVVIALSSPFALRVVDAQPPPDAVAAGWGVGFALLPVVMLGALVRRRRGRAPIGAVLAAMERAGGRRSLRDTVADVLGDPTMDFAFRDRARGGWRLADGTPVDPQEGARVLTPMGDGKAMLHDPVLLEDPMLLETIAGTAALALEHERLGGEVRAQLDEAGAVRARIVRASDDARRRIERDLHDGAQQTLVSLALALGMLEEELEDDADELALRLVRHAAAQADAALSELRDLARGVFPALLVVDGLLPALEELAAQSPLRVGLDLTLPVRAAPDVEAAAWFLVREGLANAEHHGRARNAVVRARMTGEVLDVEVLDDGAGGASIIPGGALEQLADRVVALGGRVSVGDAPGGGTRLAATFGSATRPAPPAASAPRAVPSG